MKQYWVFENGLIAEEGREDFDLLFKDFLLLKKLRNMSEIIWKVKKPFKSLYYD